MTGSIDILRIKEHEGEKVYVIQDEKFRDPPSQKWQRVYSSDKLQIDAYAYLAEACGYKPVESGIIIYNDSAKRNKSKSRNNPSIYSKSKGVIR